MFMVPTPPKMGYALDGVMRGKLGQHSVCHVTVAAFSVILVTTLLAVAHVPAVDLSCQDILMGKSAFGSKVFVSGVGATAVQCNKVTLDCCGYKSWYCPLSCCLPSIIGSSLEWVVLYDTFPVQVCAGLRFWGRGTVPFWKPGAVAQRLQGPSLLRRGVRLSTCLKTFLELLWIRFSGNLDGRTDPAAGLVHPDGEHYYIHVESECAWKLRDTPSADTRRCTSKLARGSACHAWNVPVGRFSAPRKTITVFRLEVGKKTESSRW